MGSKIIMENNTGKTTKNENSTYSFGWPTTVDDAVDSILSSMSKEDKQTVKCAKEADLIMFHFGWGNNIRNQFGLWAGNQELLASCGELHPDDASGVIIKGVWDRLKQENQID